MILKTLSLDFVNMAGSDTYLESVVVINRIKFMLYFSYSFESQFTLVHVLCQCCMNSTLRFSTENTSSTLLIFQSVYSLFYWQSMCVISLICLCKCVLSLDCSFNQMGFSNTCKKYYITTFLSVNFILSIFVVNVFDEERVNSTSIVIHMLFNLFPM